MAHLYVNSRGTEWRKHSYSAGQDFDSSPYKYFLRRVMGWKERENKGRFLFGRALEEAIQFHHDHMGNGAVEAFVRNWEPYRDQKDIIYTKTERDWANLNRAGQEMVRLYIAKQPKLPIPLGANVSFQQEYSKEVFPGNATYGGIEDAGKLDIIAYVEPDHPMLTKVDWKPEWGTLRPVIVDIKTAGQNFPETRGIAAFDTQLRRYSWLSGIRDVALLWFVKTGGKLQKGVSISLLEGAGRYEAGDEAVVANMADDGDAWLVPNDFMLGEMENAQGRSALGRLESTKVAYGRRDQWLAQYAIKVPTDIITRQRLQFNTGFVTRESAEEAGMDAGRQIMNIVNAWNANQWPNTFGIRYPHDNRTDPYFTAFVLGDENFKKLNFVKTDEETLNDLFADDDQGEQE